MGLASRKGAANARSPAWRPPTVTGRTSALLDDLPVLAPARGDVADDGRGGPVRRGPRRPAAGADVQPGGVRRGPLPRLRGRGPHHDAPRRHHGPRARPGELPAAPAVLAPDERRGDRGDGLIGFPPVFDVLASRVLALPPEVADRAQLAVAVFLPWPAAIGFRRFQQGILIAAGRTRLVAYGTVVRLSTMAATGLALFLDGGLDGAVVGAAALSAGVVVEAAASWAWARSDRKRLSSSGLPASPGDVPTLADIQRFYWPLAVTPLMNMAASPS